MIRDAWDKSDKEPKDDRIVEDEWIVLSGHFDQLTKDNCGGNYLKWTEDELKAHYKLILESMANQKADFDPAKGMEFDLFVLQG